MKKKLSLTYSLLIVFSIFVMFLSGILIARNSLLNQAKDSVIVLTHAYMDSFDGNTTDMVLNEQDVRETIVSTDGTVLWDSIEEATKMENHLDRQEVKAAIDKKPTVVIRDSPTLGTRYLYYAEIKNVSGTDYVIRISLKMSSLTEYMTSYIPWVSVTAVMTVIVAVILSVYFAKRVERPIKSVEDNLLLIKEGKSPVQDSSTDKDFSAITESIYEISASLSESITNLKEEKDKLELVLDTVAEPMIAYDDSDNVIFKNNSYIDTFDCDFAQSDLIEERMTYKGKTYSITVNRKAGISLYLLTDISKTVSNEQLRQEFFDSSSHELKTPLTAIRGFNELIELKSDDEDIKMYSQNISKETKRMLSIITDMLKISSLEYDERIESDPLELSQIVDEVKHELLQSAYSKNVVLNTNGHGTFRMKKDDAYSLVKNLMENAIIYNVDGGYVNVLIEEGKFSVEDNGIGIKEEDQKRVFERFYRADKSRSRELGGTGLGLSIVKHIVLHYGGRLELSSRPGFGTKITVTFND